MEIISLIVFFLFLVIFTLTIMHVIGALLERWNADMTSPIFTPPLPEDIKNPSSAINQRAERLLISHLDKTQAEDYIKNGGFYVPSKHYSNRVYRITHATRCIYAYETDWRDRVSSTHTLGIEPRDTATILQVSGAYPKGDVMLAKKLALEASEAKTVGQACEPPRDVPKIIPKYYPKEIRV